LEIVSAVAALGPNLPASLQAEISCYLLLHFLGLRKTGLVEDFRANAIRTALLVHCTPWASHQRIRCSATSRNIKFSRDLGGVQQVLRFKNFFEAFDPIRDQVSFQSGQILHAYLFL